MELPGRSSLLALVAAATLYAEPSPAVAQIPAVIVGRVEDAATRAPLADVRVWAADSTSWALTDSTGTFAIELSANDRLTLHAAAFGYVSDSFELADGAASRVTVLLLEPAPLELPGIDVEAEAALARVARQLESRRNAYPYSVATYDRDVIESSTAYGSAWEFLKSRLPDIYECATSLSGLCVGDPGLAFDNRSQWDAPPRGDQDPLRVCVDGIESTLAIQELRMIDMRRLALLEVYRGGRGGVRVYSATYLAAAARSGGVYIAPTHTWGTPGNAFSGRC